MQRQRLGPDDLLRCDGDRDNNSNSGSAPRAAAYAGDTSRHSTGLDKIIVLEG